MCDYRDCTEEARCTLRVLPHVPAQHRPTRRLCWAHAAETVKSGRVTILRNLTTQTPSKLERDLQAIPLPTPDPTQLSEPPTGVNAHV